ncbi:basic amino acid ABC transporter substrate-binding protein [Natronococcus pandeyae]|uniref:Basic amino acid ABC transporter substrate-binding protein n=1 Tax=Natronococcus pandeyae TaxID=2055836 RepID=A0A8J8PZ06_9EURY|nr:transporter substrate-binding domain-containing protein [Natronococcus pandeyae]TYL36257.1 basic amino acid ABC transporter substrate-binding protein [Natronococcus pandeyae]
MSGVTNDHITRRDALRYGGTTGVVLLAAGCLGEDGDPEAAAEDDEGGAEDDDGEIEADENDEENGEAEGIVVGTEAGFPPFEMIEDGEIVGFDVDLTEAVLEEAEGYEHEEWQDMEFGSLIPALEDGSIDLIAAAMTITEEREEQIAFTDPYFSADQSVLVAEDADFQPESLEDFDGQTVAAQVGTTGEGVVEEELIEEGRIGEGDYSSYDSYVLAVEDLERGIVEAIVIDEPVGDTFADERNVEVAFTHETGEEFGLGVRQEDDDLREALNEGLATIEEDSTFDDLVAEWFGGDDADEDDEDEDDEQSVAGLVG